jgi:hypothetical protein
MPTKFGLEVVIVNGDNEVDISNDDERVPYREYGTTILRSAGSSERHVSTKIEAQTDRAFMIRWKPVGPFPVGRLDEPTGTVDSDEENATVFQQPCPYSLAVKVFIDGQILPEHSRIHTGMTPPAHYKVVYIHGREVAVGMDGSGQVAYDTFPWKFSEVGVEVQLRNLHVRD